MDVETFQDQVRRASEELEKRYGAPQEGRHRRVFLDREAGEVVKVPLFPSGLDANLQELVEQEPHLARTWLDEDSETFGLPLLRMELVEPASRMQPLPRWTRHIDDQQVGWTRDGRLVAYDWDTR